MTQSILYYKIIFVAEITVRRSGGTGRRTGLKILRSLKTVPVRFRSPAPGSAYNVAGSSSQVARRAHNPEGGGSNPSPATNEKRIMAA